MLLLLLLLPLLLQGEWGPYNMEIVDHVILPATLEDGEYVVGFRWDCEVT